MKKILILILIPFLSFTQVDVPDEYWLDDNTFEEIISGDTAFGDDDQETVVIEFWAKFNEANCLADWDLIENAAYYRVDIANAPIAKKKYKVRMAPTIIIFRAGVKEFQWKAGLDLELPTSIEEIQESIDEINNANQF